MTDMMMMIMMIYIFNILIFEVSDVFHINMGIICSSLFESAFSPGVVRQTGYGATFIRTHLC
jgi:hypothetical protein